MREGKENRTAKKVFLSYAVGDRPPAAKLRAMLASHTNWETFTTDDLSAGDGWVAKLKRELEECDLFIFLLSPNSLTSALSLQELGAAWGIEKRILVVYTHPEIVDRLPISLPEEQMVSLSEFETPEFISHFLDYSEAAVTSR